MLQNLLKCCGKRCRRCNNSIAISSLGGTTTLKLVAVNNTDKKVNQGAASMSQFGFQYANAITKSAAAALLAATLTACAGTSISTPTIGSEVRGTWLTTTANDAITSPAKTASTMQRLRDIGLNTVYVEVWKNGYTQYPSEVLRATIGVDRHPALALQDLSDSPAQPRPPARDLLRETLIEAHRNGLVYLAWFEYGFMAAHQSTHPHLRRMKPEWLSRDITGNEVAPNGFVWMNPVHPEARRFLLDLVLEAIEHYDLDGIQLDDRIVWPHVTMGYDDTTKKIYAEEHAGAAPPSDHNDPAWMRWRADKVNEYAKWFVQEVRARRPGLIVSLSPAVYSWSWEHYLLEWPKWGAWTAEDRVQSIPTQSAASKNITPRWDEFIPQAYRFNYPAFESTWKEQVAWMKKLGANRQRDLIAGIRLTSDSVNDSTWEQLRDSMMLARNLGNGGHVHWFSRGVLDIFSKELTAFYAQSGTARSPHFPAGWRQPSIPLFRHALGGAALHGEPQWIAHSVPRGAYRIIGFDGRSWEYVDEVPVSSATAMADGVIFNVPSRYTQVELVVDRRAEMMRVRRSE